MSTLRANQHKPSLSILMAASAKFLSFFFFFFFLTLSCSLHVHARDSQFFSKVTANNNNNQETELPKKEALLSKQEQDPTFIPDTQNGYGLYGHESGQLPPATITTTAKVYPSTNTNTNNYYNNKEAYVTEPQGLSDTRFMERGYTTPINSNNYYTGANTYNAQQQEGMGESKFMYTGYTTPTNGNNNNNNYYNNAQQQGMDRGYTTTNGNNNYYNSGNNGYNVEKQGMSDTRFLENGKYYYDPKNENYNRNEYQHTRTNSRNGYNAKGYYGNNNNENSYEYNNSMEGFQNQEEYPENQDDQFVP